MSFNDNAQPATSQPSGDSTMPPVPVATASPAPNPQPSVPAGSGPAPATGAPADSGSAVVAPTPHGSPSQPEHEFGSVAHNIFQALAGGPKRTLDPETGTWTSTPLTKGGIARGVIAGALAGMFAGMQRGPGKYPGGPMEALGKGGAAGMALTQQQREQQVEDAKIKDQQQLKAATIYETNSRSMLNMAQASNLKTEALKDQIGLNQFIEEQGNTDPQFFASDMVHSEDELQEGIKSGKFLPGSHLGLIVGLDRDANGNPVGMYRVIADPTAKITLTPEKYDQAARVNPQQFPLVHKDGTPLTDGEKKQTMAVGDLIGATNRGVSGYTLPNEQLKGFKSILGTNPLASSMPESIDPKYSWAWRTAQKDIAYAHMDGKNHTFLEKLNATIINPMTKQPVSAVPPNVRNSIFASLGNGDPVLGEQILTAVDSAQKAQQAGAKSAAEQHGRLMSQIDTPEKADAIINDPNSTDAEVQVATAAKTSLLGTQKTKESNKAAVKEETDKRVYAQLASGDKTGWKPAPNQFMSEQQFNAAKQKFGTQTLTKTQDIERSYQMMQHAYGEYLSAKGNLPSGAQSMVALSTHLATTFGNVKGARVTKDMIQEHLGARSVSDDALVAVRKLTSGDVLSPQQWKAFSDLITTSRNLAWDNTVSNAHYQGLPADFLPSGYVPKGAIAGRDPKTHQVIGYKLPSGDIVRF